MSRKRVTQLFPSLIPLREWQRKKLYYLKMKLDGVKYSNKVSNTMLENTVYKTSTLLLNENSGFDIKYQYNKIHNIKLIAKKLNKIVIEPNDTFSFWKLAKEADRYEKYKEGLCLVNGKYVGTYGGGVCQLTSMLYWMFLHTPLTVTERYSHASEAFPSADEWLPSGTDCAVNEGWLDLKVKNDTDNTFQIEISFDDEYMYGKILSKKPTDKAYTVFNPYVNYEKQDDDIYQIASVCRCETDKITKRKIFKELYVNRCQIEYELPANVKIKERGA